MNDVSFYIPCFNAARTIAFCLDAVLSQTVGAKEVMVVDDGSTDDTARIVSGYPVKLIRHASNRGLAAARNSAIRQTRGALIASVDADCVCEKNWLEMLMGCLTTDGIAGAGGKLLEARIRRPADLWRSVHMKQHWGDTRIEPSFLFGANTVFRRSALEKAGLYDEALKNNYEDVELCRRLKKSGYTLAYEPKAIAYHVREDSPAALLNAYWRWHLPYYRQEQLYASAEKFRFKIREDLGTANRYLEEDMAAGRPSLLYLDFFLAFHHALKDLKVFMDERQPASDAGVSALSLWLGCMDLVFFCRFDKDAPQIRTLMKPASAYEQNCFALMLILGSTLREKFPSGRFGEMVFSRLIDALFQINDPLLSEKIFSAACLQPDWKNLLKKSHPHLDKDFLEEFSGMFVVTVERLLFRFPGIARAIEVSANDTFKEAS